MWWHFALDLHLDMKPLDNEVGLEVFNFALDMS